MQAALGYNDDEKTLNSFNFGDVNAIYGIYMNFVSMKKKGKIESEFEDDKWYLSNLHKHVPIIFGKVDSLSITLTDKEKYKIALKLITVLLFRKYSKESVQKTVNWLIKTGICQNFEWEKNIHVHLTKLKKYSICELCKLLAIDFDEGKLGNTIFPEKQKDNQGDNRRELCHSYYSYFVIDDELDKFWKSASKEDKILFGPLFLFWKICSIIPTRPDSFTIIPKNPIRYCDGKVYLIMRPSHIKGGNVPVHNDYRRDSPTKIYRINEDTAKLVMEYQEIIKDTIADKDLLFNNIARNRLIKNKALRCEEKFQVDHLNQLQEKFIKKICREKGYTLRKYVNGDTTLDYEQGIIEPINLGDLRHLSLITMIFLGIDPALIMEMAGHENVASACHYFGNSKNIDNLYVVFLEQNKFSVARLNRNNRKSLESKGLSKIQVIGGECLGVNGALCIQYDGHVGCPNFVPYSSQDTIRLKGRYNAEMDAALNTLKNSKEIENKEKIKKALMTIEENAIKVRKLENICHAM